MKVKERLRCKCGESVAIDRMETIIEVGVPDPKVICVVRRFWAACPKCGPFYSDKVGHHDTIGETEMTRLFPRGQRKKIRKALSSIAERKRFDQTMSGKRQPTDEEVSCWLDLKKSIHS
jgi:hypothetical protein